MSITFDITGAASRFGLALLVAGNLCSTGALPASSASADPFKALALPVGGAATFAAEAAQELKRVPYQRNIESECDVSPSVCEVNFAVTGRKQWLEITHVSCVTVSTGDPIYLGLRNSVAIDFFPSTKEDAGYSVFNILTEFSTPPRNNVDLIYFDTGDISGVACTISGEMVFLK